jgi:hypothetical protein
MNASPSPVDHIPPAQRGALEVAEYVLHFVSVFEVDAKTLARFREAPWAPTPPIIGELREILIDQYTPEFRNVIFLDNEDASINVGRFERSWRPDDASAQFKTARKDKRNRTLLPGEPFRLERARVFTFEKSLGGLGLFVFEVRHAAPNPTLAQLSNLGDQLRGLSASVLPIEAAGPVADTGGESIPDLINRVILPGVDIRKCRVNEYSGSKLKTFIAVDLKDKQSPAVLHELLYDLGCFVPIGSAGGQTDFTPSRDYFEQIIRSAMGPFRNYSALTLLDAFVAVGNDFLNNAWKRKTWSDTYLGIYVYNLFVKFRGQQLMADLHETASRSREACQYFLAKFNLVHISYNFLPTLLHENMRRGLETKRHLKSLDRHIQALSKLIEEDAQKRQALLLGLVSVGTIVQALPTYFEHVPEVQAAVHLSGFPFWALSSVILLLVVGFVLNFLFPEQARLVKRKLRKLRRKPDASTPEAPETTPVR